MADAWLFEPAVFSINKLPKGFAETTGAKRQ